MPNSFDPDSPLARTVYDAAKIAHEAVAKLNMNDGPTLIAATTLIRAILGVQDSTETREAALARLDVTNAHLAATNDLLASVAGSIASVVTELGKIRAEVARIADSDTRGRPDG